MSLDEYPPVDNRGTVFVLAGIQIIIKARKASTILEQGLALWLALQPQATTS
jgi:hypothetical protein